MMTGSVPAQPDEATTQPTVLGDVTPQPTEQFMTTGSVSEVVTSQLTGPESPDPMTTGPVSEYVPEVPNPITM